MNSEINDNLQMQDGNGMVSTSEIKFVLTRLGVELTDEELGEMVQVIYNWYFFLQLFMLIWMQVLNQEPLKNSPWHFQEADINGDQHVSFEEFRDIFNEG